MHPRRQFDTAFCQWECPLCGATAVSVRADVDCQSTCNNLRTHIRATSDAVHGPHGEYPPDIDPYELTAYISCDRREKGFIRPNS